MPPTVVRRTLDLAGVEVPYVEVTGSAGGPELTVIAGVHGCEYASIAGVRQWAARARVGRTARPGAGRAGAEHVGVPRQDGRSWCRRTARTSTGASPATRPARWPSGWRTPRSASSSWAADAVIDVHCGDLVEALEPFTLYEAGPAEDRARALARAYGLGYVLRQEPGPGRAVGGTTSAAAAQIGVPAITAEAGGCGLVEQAAVELHVRGLDRVLAELGMTGAPTAAGAVGEQSGEGTLTGADGTADGTQEPSYLGRFLWLRCADEGWWEPAVKVGDKVAAGQLLGSVSSLDGAGTRR